MMLLSSLTFAEVEPVYVEVIATHSIIRANAFSESKALYKTKQGNTFLLMGELNDFLQIRVIGSKSGWVSKQDFAVVPSVNSLQQPVLEKISTFTREKDLYTFSGQENYRFPRRESSTNFDVDIGGFYEVKMSGRDYSPDDIDNPLFQTIINDEAYKKIPRDVLKGPFQIDYRSKVNIEGRLSEDLYIFYDIDQQPDMPNKYDVRIKYKKKENGFYHDLQFFHFDSSFSQGSLLNVSKSLRGAQYKYMGDSRFFQLSMGKQRSDSRSLENFGTGSKLIKLSHKFIYPGSVHVYVNHNKKKENSDYFVDYYKGEVTFASPPQKTDFYKIIYEYSNPIADYLPMLARKNFFGTQFSLTSQTTHSKELQSSKAFDHFDKSPLKTSDFSIITYNYSYTSQIPSFTPSLYDDLVILLIEDDILNKDRTLSDQYSPSDNLVPLLQTPSFIDFSDEIIQSIALFNVDTVLQRTLFTESESSDYSAIQLFPDSFSTFEQFSPQDSDALFYELLSLGIINSQGFIRNNILHSNSVLPQESTFYLYDASLSQFLKEFMIEKKPNLQEKFFLSHHPIVLGSETLTLNDLALQPNIDYSIDHKHGIITFLLPLSREDSIDIHYTYFHSASHEEDIVGKNSIGPYQLSHAPVLDDSVTLLLNNEPLAEIRDYIVDYDTGELYVNFEVPYPDLLSLRYQYINSVETEHKSKKQPFDISAAYVREFVPADDEAQILQISSENLTIDPTAPFFLSQNPLTNTENISIIVNNTKLLPSDYTIISEYRSEIQLSDSLNLTTSQNVSVSYKYLKSHKTKVIFTVDHDFVNIATYNQTGEDIIFTETPIKFDGVDYITLWNGSSEIRLEEGKGFEVEYDESGAFLSLKFFDETAPGHEDSKLDSNESILNKRITIHYDFTPGTASQVGDVFHHMIGTTIKAHLSDSWEVDAELAVAGNNFSAHVLNGEVTMSGTGEDNHFYSFGETNIVEDSEQIFINSESQTKDSDYFINYKNGTFRFKNSPQSADEIFASFQYYERNKNITTGEAQYSYATKISSTYTTPTLNFSSSFTYIDKEFEPVGSIQDSKGNAIFNSSIGWTPSSKTTMTSSYARHKEFKKNNALNKPIYLHKDLFNLSLNNSIFDLVDANHSFSYNFNLQDADETFNDDFTHDVDTLMYSYSGGYSFGPSYMPTTIAQTFSRSLDDYRDNLLPKDTRTKSIDYKSSLTFNDVFLLGNTSLTPTYYTSFSETLSSQAPTRNFKRTQTASLSSSFKPLPSLSFKTGTNFSETKQQSSSTAPISINQAKKYSASSTYTPFSWFSNQASFSHDETLSPLLSQSSDETENISYSVRKLQPYHAFRLMGLSKDNYLSTVVSNTNITYYYKQSNSKTNNSRKFSDSSSNKWNANALALLPSLSINNLTFSQYSSSNDNLVPQATSSRNYSTSLSHSYSGNLSFKPTFSILSYTTYAYSLSESDQQSSHQLFSRVTTGNKAEQLVFTRDISHSFNIQSPQFYIINPFNKKYRIRLGKGSLKYVYSVAKSTNESSRRNMRYNTLTDTHDLKDLTTSSIDNSYRDSISISPYFSAFNRVDLSGGYSATGVYLNRNKFGGEGSTYQDKKNYTFSTSYSPFSFISFSASFAQNRSSQFKSPSVNVSRDELKYHFIQKTPLFGGFINSFSRSYTGSITLSPFRFLSITGSGSLREINEVTTTLTTDTDSDYEVKTIGGKLGLTPIDNLSISFSYDLNDTNGEKGVTNVLTASYAPPKSTYSQITFNYSRHQSTGTGFNTIQQESSEQGSGDIIKTEVLKRSDVVQKGSVNISSTYPLENPYVQKFVIEAEGYLKSVVDNKNEDSNYEISGLVFKGTLHF